MENLLVILIAALALWRAWQMVREMRPIQNDLTTLVWWESEDEPAIDSVADDGEFAVWITLEILCPE